MLLLLRMALGWLLAAVLIPPASAQLFSPSRLLPVLEGGVPSTALLTDVNGDGTQEIVYVEEAQEALVFVDVVADGRFTLPEALLAAPSLPASALGQGDMDGDGDEDLVFVVRTGPNAGAIMLVRRRAQGFPRHAEVIGQGRPSYTPVQLVDFDGDGDLDVLAAETGVMFFEVQDVAIYENQGAGTLAPRRVLSTIPVGSILDFDVSDLDGSGTPDLAIIGTRSLNVAYGIGGGAAGPILTLQGSPVNFRSLLAGDVDGDGDVDLVTSEEGIAGVSVLENSGGGSFAAGAPLRGMPSTAGSTAVLDLNLDGVLDIVAGSSTGTFVFAGQPTGGFSDAELATVSTGASFVKILASDLSGDGVVDLVGPVLIQGTFGLQFAQHRGTAQAPLLDAQRAITLSFSGEITGSWADFDGDDQEEIVLGSLTSDFPLTVLTREAADAPTFVISQPATLGMSAAEIVAADLSGDGLDDLLVVTDTQQLYVVPRTGPLALGTPVRIGTASREETVLAEDVDTDGDLDVVVRLPGSSRIAAYPNHGGYAFGAATVFYASPAFGTQALFADLDADGDRDMVLEEFDPIASTRSLVWYERSGSALVPRATLFNGTVVPRSLVAADFNVDGELDLAWSDALLGTRWSRNTGGGMFAASSDFQGFQPTIGPMLAVDENLDGAPDLLVLRNSVINVLVNDGAGQLIYRADLPAGTERFVAGDREGDGDLDLLIFTSAGESPWLVENAARATIGSSYCRLAVPNSTGVGATLSAEGSLDVATNVVELRAGNLPSNAFGFFMVSRQRALVTQVPGSIGRLCLGGAIGRYVGPGQILQSGGAGVFTLAIDLQTIPQPNGPVAALAGDTWNFQAWFRDSGAGGGSTSNFTSGLSIVLR